MEGFSYLASTFSGLTDHGKKRHKRATIMETAIWKIHNEGLKVYEENASDIDTTKKSIQYITPKLIREQWTGLMDQFTTFEALAIGPGRGDKDIEILRHLTSRFKKVVYHVVEPEGQSLRQFQRKVEKEFSAEKVTFEWRQEVASSELSMDRRYHLITLFHVISYIKDSEDFLRHCHDNLHSNGVILLQIDSDINNGLDFLAETKIVAPLKRTQFFSGAFGPLDVEKILLSCKLRYDKYHYEGSLDISECFAVSSQRGHRFLQYLLLQENMDSTNISEEVKQIILDHLKESNYVDNSNGKSTVKDEFDLLVIYKR
ncbi:histamine N-methyltransferase-like [Saccoglossus kowalevskii]